MGSIEGMATIRRIRSCPVSEACLTATSTAHFDSHTTAVLSQTVRFSNDPLSKNGKKEHNKRLFLSLSLSLRHTNANKRANTHIQAISRVWSLTDSCLSLPLSSSVSLPPSLSPLANFFLFIFPPHGHSHSRVARRHRRTRIRLSPSVGTYFLPDIRRSHLYSVSSQTSSISNLLSFESFVVAANHHSTHDELTLDFYSTHYLLPSRNNKLSPKISASKLPVAVS